VIDITLNIAMLASIWFPGKYQFFHINDIELVFLSMPNLTLQLEHRNDRSCGVCLSLGKK
jgi:hypothetical protein